ncbi:MAG: hypothetical protein GY765_40455, partial [bacterium]|nr:hypothetical protein [bacterium]
LTSLHLNHNGLNDVSFLRDLPALTSLGLRHNHLKDVSFLQELPALTSLDLSYNRLNDVSFLRDLPALTSLNLNENQLTDVSVLRDLPALTSLHLRINKLNDVSFLRYLPALISLNLSNTGLTDVSFLRNLPSLTSLHLSSNELKDVSFLRDLPSLTSLDLSYNELKDVSPLRDLPSLTSLDLSRNKIKDVSFLRDLPALTSLHLRSNNLRSNNLKDVSFLRDLPALTSLVLRDNEVNDVSSLRDLPALTLLWLQNNKITDVSFIRHLEHLTDLDLDDNPIETPPPEIVNQGPAAIRDYFKSLEAAPETVQLTEVKVLLVGDGGAGKTSLLKRLKGKSFDPKEPKTHGIAIHTLKCPKAGSHESDCIQAHVWDFGGQEIMHASHQFFLSKRALYILLVDGREERDPDYWLHHIRTFGGDSPVLVVINKTDQHNHHLENNTLMRKYPNIKGFFLTSCADGTGIAEFQKALYREIPNIELLQTPIPASWMRVKSRLESQTAEECYIDHRQFETICTEEGIPADTTRETLVGFLNELGIVLHFKEWDLDKFHVLNPRWVTEGVYRIINSPTLEQAKGVLPVSQLDTIINREKTKTNPMQQEHGARDYDEDERRYLVKLMEKFQLCYQLENGNYLVPGLLPKDTSKPDAPQLEAQKTEAPAGGALHFLVTYDFLPKSLVPRLIIALQNDVQPAHCWRSGLRAEHKETKTYTLVRADNKEKRLSIAVSGEGKREYLIIIRRALQEIYRSFERLDYKELVPLPGPEGRTVEYTFLLGYERKGVKMYLDGHTGREHDVKELLDTISFAAQRREERPIHLHVDNSARLDARLSSHVETETEVEFHGQTRETTAEKEKKEAETKEKERRLKEEIKRLDAEIEQLENRLAHVTGRRTVLDEEARKRTAWFYVVLGIPLVVLAIIGAIGFVKNWNMWEPLTFIGFTLLVVLVDFFIIAFTGKGFSLSGKWEKRLEKNKRKKYTYADFDAKEEERLEKKLEAARQRKEELLKD